MLLLRAGCDVQVSADSVTQAGVTVGGKAVEFNDSATLRFCNFGFRSGGDGWHPRALSHFPVTYIPGFLQELSPSHLFILVNAAARESE